MGIKVWRLSKDSNKDLALQPHDIEYFQSHFIGKPMMKDWTPPPVKVLGKSKRVRDFVSWMPPVVSEAAKSALEPLVSSCAEFLPLIEIKGKKYYALNVVCSVDAIDKSRSKHRAGPQYNKAYFIKERLREVPIFKASDDKTTIFVTEKFVDAVLSANLKGARFEDPREDPFYYVLHGPSGVDETFVAKLKS